MASAGTDGSVEDGSVLMARSEEGGQDGSGDGQHSIDNVGGEAGMSMASATAAAAAAAGGGSEGSEDALGAGAGSGQRHNSKDTASDPPLMVFRRTAGTALHEASEAGRQRPPLQLLRGDATMRIATPLESIRAKSRHTARNLDRWMVVFSAPSNSRDEQDTRGYYRRFFFALTALNIAVTTLLLAIVWANSSDTDDHVFASTLASRRLRGAESVGNIVERAEHVGLLPTPTHAPRHAAAVSPQSTGDGSSQQHPLAGIAPPFSSATSASDMFSGLAFLFNYAVTMLIALLGVVAAWTHSHRGVTAYMLATTLWMFATALHVPSPVFALRYILDCALLWVASRLRKTLMPQWFSAHQLVA